MKQNALWLLQQKIPDTWKTIIRLPALWTLNITIMGENHEPQKLRHDTIPIW